MDFIKRLISSNDKSADSVIVGGLLALLVLCATLAWDVMRNRHQLNAMDFGGGAGAIIGSVGVAKGWRDRLTPVGNPATQLPEKQSDVIAAENGTT